MALVAGVAVFAFVFAPAMFANAQAFGTSTAAEQVNDLIDAVSLVIGAVIGGIVTLLAGLYGLGWGKRKVQKHITGQKF